jgi:citrate lyase beta subunit
MNGITIFQCIPSYKPMPTARLIRTLTGTGCNILLDLEDSIQDVVHPQQTPILKEKAREDLLEIIHNLPEQKFSLRINAVTSGEFTRDKEILNKAGGSIESIFLPKTEHVDELAIFVGEFGHRFRLNLILETQKGIENAGRILAASRKRNTEFVFFGNYDYHLDKNIYPIVDQNREAYWETVAPIISSVEKHGLKFGNSPYANLADTGCLGFSLGQLMRYCRRGFALMSLHKCQTLSFRRLIREFSAGKPLPPDGIHLAATQEEFTMNRLKGRSFAINPQNRIITPQEYLLLRRRQNG